MSLGAYNANAKYFFHGTRCVCDVFSLTFVEALIYRCLEFLSRCIVAVVIGKVGHYIWHESTLEAKPCTT